MVPVRRWGATLGALFAIAVAVVFRIPSFLSTGHLGYDDSVYGSSVMLMRAGLDPYSDFFASQGPLFLPLLRVFDMTGIGGVRAPRLAMVATGAALGAGLYLIASRNHGPYRSGVAALTGASSGVLLIAAGPLQSDGLALAFGLFAIAAASGNLSEKQWLAPAAGVLLGMALATKSLHLLPIALVVLTLIVIRGSRSALTAFLLSTVFTGVLVTWPWGFEEVWNQYVLFHLSKSAPLDPIGNVAALADLLWAQELPLIVLLATGLALRLRRPSLTFSRPLAGAAIPGWLLWAWTISTLTVIIFITGSGIGFSRFGAFLIPPLILLAMRSSLPTWLVFGFVILAIPYQWSAIRFTNVVTPTQAETEVIAILSDLPEDSYIVTDAPGLAWSAGRLSHPDTVDSSYARIETGSITQADVATATEDSRSCAYVPWSGRFGAFGPLTTPPAYGIALDSSRGFVAVRVACQTP